MRRIHLKYLYSSFCVLLDDEEKAKKHCEYRRDIEPKAYSESKLRYGNKFNQRKSHADDNNEIEQCNEMIDDSKLIIQEQIATKMREMDNITFDLSDSDIEDFQSIIDANSDDGADFDDTDVFFPVEECSSVNETGRDSISGCGESSQIHVASCSVTSTLVEPTEQHTANFPHIIDDSFAFLPDNAKMPIAFTSKIEPATMEKGQQFLNDREIDRELRCAINEREIVDSHQIDPNAHAQKGYFNKVICNTNTAVWRSNDFPSSSENPQIIDDSFAFVPDDAKMPIAFDSKIDPATFKNGQKMLKDREMERDLRCAINERENVDSSQIDPNAHTQKYNPNNVNCNTNTSILPTELTFVIENIKDHIPPKYQCAYDTVNISILTYC